MLAKVDDNLADAAAGGWVLIQHPKLLIVDVGAGKAEVEGYAFRIEILVIGLQTANSATPRPFLLLDHSASLVSVPPNTGDLGVKVWRNPSPTLSFSARTAVRRVKTISLPRKAFE